MKGKVTFLLGALILVWSLPTNALDLSFGSVLKSAGDITEGVIKDAGNLLPTPEGMFGLGKNLIAGYPFEFVSSAINKICSSALSSNVIKPKVTPDINQMQFQLRTTCGRFNFPLTQASKMWTNPEFNPKKKVVIFVTGWTSSVNDTAIDVMAKAYNCRGDVNFIALDAGSYVDTLYTWSAFNTEAIGESMAVGLAELVKIVPLKSIHLIGHSLGAHIVGTAARGFYEITGEKLSRVTGLDPAKPCFNEGENLSGLLRGYSDVVDVIHSNAGVLGKKQPLGDIDFYPGGMVPLIPGCLDIVCAHSRAWKFYAETVYPENEHNFMANRCRSLVALRENKCPGESLPMGYAVDTASKGNFFLEINTESPFGHNAHKNALKEFETCGLCAKPQKQ